jgi:hypothetical protein
MKPEEVEDANAHDEFILRVDYNAMRQVIHDGDEELYTHKKYQNKNYQSKTY